MHTNPLAALFGALVASMTANRRQQPKLRKPRPSRDVPNHPLRHPALAHRYLSKSEAREAFKGTPGNAGPTRNRALRRAQEKARAIRARGA